MKTSQLKQSKYLKKEDCDPPIVVTIKDVSEENMAMEGEPDKMRWIMYFVEVPKGLVLNVENGEMLEEITGSDDSSGWTGWKIQLWNNPSIKFGGKKVGGIRIKPITDHTTDLRDEPDIDEANRQLDEEADKRRRRYKSEPEEEADIPF